MLRDGGGGGGVISDGRVSSEMIFFFQRLDDQNLVQFNLPPFKNRRVAPAALRRKDSLWSFNSETSVTKRSVRFVGKNVRLPSKRIKLSSYFKIVRHHRLKSQTDTGHLFCFGLFVEPQVGLDLSVNYSLDFP